MERATDKVVYLVIKPFLCCLYCVHTDLQHLVKMVRCVGLHVLHYCILTRSELNHSVDDWYLDVPPSQPPQPQPPQPQAISFSRFSQLHLLYKCWWLLPSLLVFYFLTVIIHIVLTYLASDSFRR